MKQTYILDAQMSLLVDRELVDEQQKLLRGGAVLLQDGVLRLALRAVAGHVGARVVLLVFGRVQEAHVRALGQGAGPAAVLSHAQRVLDWRGGHAFVHLPKHRPFKADTK
jgi:hypothetical protein